MYPIKPGLIPRDEKDFAKLMKSKKKPSLLKAMFTMRGGRSLMYYTGKNLKQAGKTKQLKQFKKDMLGLSSKRYINKYL